MSLPKLIIAIGTELDSKGLKKADTALIKMTKTAMKLSSALGLAYATKQIIAYGKAAAMAAAADQKSQMLLSAQLKTLGMAYANVGSEKFIKSLETQSAIADEVLRPSYAQLARVTGSVAATEKIMAASFDASAGAGLSYAQTVDILSQAYVGNTKGLKALNLGLSNAEVSALSFDELLALLNKQFSGAGKTSMAGYAGSIDKLNLAMGNASEIIGGSLLDGFARLVGGGDIDKATGEIENFAGALGLAIGAMTGGASFADLVNKFFRGTPDAGMGHPSMKAPKVDTSLTDRVAENAARKKAALEKKAAAALAAQLKKAENERKAAAALAAKDKKNSDDVNAAAAMFDMNKISIAAALQSTYDKETKLRLLAMQAIANDNGELALEYEKKLGFVQAENLANKLKGITTVTNETLSALNQHLLNELKVINDSDMVASEKEAERLNAFTKYNDALSKSGGLALAITYNQKVQDQLAMIEKIALLNDYGAAADFLDKFLLRVATDSIDQIADAQTVADEAKTNAMISYIGLLQTATGAALDLAAALTPVVVPGVDGAIGDGKGPDGSVLVPVIPDVTPVPDLPPGGGGYSRRGREDSEPASFMPIINITASVIANPIELTEIIQTSIQDMQRNGYSLNVAGAI